jgi:hypothetical protein
MDFESILSARFQHRGLDRGYRRVNERPEDPSPVPKRPSPVHSGGVEGLGGGRPCTAARTLRQRSRVRSLVACLPILWGGDRHRLAWSLPRRERWRRAAAALALLRGRRRVATGRRGSRRCRRACRRAPRVPDRCLDQLRDGRGLLLRLRDPQAVRTGVIGADDCGRRSAARPDRGRRDEVAAEAGANDICQHRDAQLLLPHVGVRHGLRRQLDPFGRPDRVLGGDSGLDGVESRLEATGCGTRSPELRGGSWLCRRCC